MKPRFTSILLLAGATPLVTLLVLSSCKHAHESDESGSATMQAAVAAAGRSGDTITLPRYQANLPDGPGRDAFATACLTCHSSRYITTQPPMTAAKWEESVKKMIATYHAPIAEDQIPLIVQYIVAARENGPKGATWDTPIAVPAPMPMDLKLGGGNVDHGRQLYVERCASCHGVTGNAQTPAAASMLPRPTDLTAGRFADERIAQAIIQGVPGTAMPGYATLSNSDVNDLVAYIGQFASPAQAGNANTPADAKALFATNCVSCHGADGRGDGVAAAPLARPPANFHVRQPTVEQANRAITNGVPGTAMAAWESRLSDAQREALAEYVRTFYQ